MASYFLDTSAIVKRYFPLVIILILKIRLKVVTQSREKISLIEISRSLSLFSPGGSL